MRWRFPRDFSDAGAGAPVDDTVREVVVTSVPFAPSVSVAGWGVPGTGRSGGSKKVAVADLSPSAPRPFHPEVAQ